MSDRSFAFAFVAWCFVLLVIVLPVFWSTKRPMLRRFRWPFT